MAKLLPGDSDAIVRENVRILKAQGFSEMDALEHAHSYARGAVDSDDSGETDADDFAYDEGEAEDSQDRQFVVVTKDFSGLGWAKKLHEEGENVTLAHKCNETEAKDKKLYHQVGVDWMDSIMTLEEAMKKLQTPTTYWVFAENAFPEQADELRAAGQRVFGTSALSEKMEHDRNYAVGVAEDSGLESPTTHEFSTREEGLALMDENPDKAYVFKPDDGKFNHLTFVPSRKKDEDANRETYTYLEHMKEDPGTYILQERIPQEEGTECCVELWLYEGEPFLATLGLELKRKDTYDIGEMAGCAGDFFQLIPLESELVKQTIGLMVPFYKEQKYTGIADVNVIFTKAGPKFLEVCNRFGYNSHPNMFLGLALDGFGSIIADFTDGQIEGMEDRFRKDVGCSLTFFLDHPREGLPLHVDPKYVEQFYPFDGYMEDGTLLLTGYSNEIGMFVDHGADMQKAWDAVWQKVVFEEAVHVSDMYYRDDLVDDNYYNAPMLRMKKLKKMGLL